MRVASGTATSEERTEAWLSSAFAWTGERNERPSRQLTNAVAQVNEYGWRANTDVAVAAKIADRHGVEVQEPNVPLSPIGVCRTRRPTVCSAPLGLPMMLEHCTSSAWDGLRAELEHLVD